MAASAAIAGDFDYSSGVFIVNEDWFGHRNSTLNYLTPDDPDGDYWHYRVDRTENEGVELGCTAQYAAIHDGRIYVVSKQDKDGGASVTGGRLSVFDAATLKVVKQLQYIAPQGMQCDGRSFIGIDAHKGYISTSNGVWVLDLDRIEITGMIDGTGNSTGNLYRDQCGSMVMAANRVFVAHQSEGLIVIDSSTDRVESVISIPEATDIAGAAIGSVVKALDGSLWVSVAKNVSGMGATSPVLLRIDPTTLSTEKIDIPGDMQAPANSWYAWTPDGFCASSVENCLYWNGGTSSWFTGTRIYKMNLDSREISLHIDYSNDPDKWLIYGCSMRPDPRNGDLYVSLYKSPQSKAYTLRRYSVDGSLVKEYPMIEDYWFPSIPFFPNPTLDGVNEVEYSEFADDVPGDLFTVSGIRVASGVIPGKLPGNLVPGIYIFRSSTRQYKIAI